MVFKDICQQLACHILALASKHISKADLMLNTLQSFNQETVKAWITMAKSGFSAKGWGAAGIATSHNWTKTLLGMVFQEHFCVQDHPQELTLLFEGNIIPFRMECNPQIVKKTFISIFPLPVLIYQSFLH